MGSTRERFGAPWSKGVTWLTVGCSLSFLILPVLIHFTLPLDPVDRLAVQTLPLMILVVLALFAVLGYEVEGRNLRIVRPLWVTRVDLAGLKEARWEPGAVGWLTMRLWGSGGWFGFFGWFRNTKLGVVRAWVTDPERTVVLRAGEKTLVISPDEPERFIGVLASPAGSD